MAQPTMNYIQYIAIIATSTPSGTTFVQQKVGQHACFLLQGVGNIDAPEGLTEQK